jgi:hypothetical protein
MSEDVPEYNSELKFVRLRGTLEDLVGYVTHYDDYIVIYKPLRVDIETLFEDNRQILSLQEYLPQAIIELQEIEIPFYDIIFTTPVKKDFIEQYEHVADYFYNVQNRGKSSIVKSKQESVSDTAQKVVSILEAMANKKDKPVH